NGNIITVDKTKARAQAVAIEGCRFAAVGSNEEILALQSAETHLVDLAGQTVVPGFNDSHMHLLNIGTVMERVDLTPARSRAQLVAIARDFLAANPELKLLLGRGWNQDRFDDQQMPTRHDLDQISTEIPIVFTRVCGHVSVVNSKALQMAGVGRGVAQVRGGQIDLDLSGEPNGVLSEEAIGLVGQLFPETTQADYKRRYQKGAALAASLGLTSVQTDDMGDLHDADAKLQALTELAAEGNLPVRVNLQIRLSKPELVAEFLELRQRWSLPADMVEFGPVKIMTDGSLGGRTAAMNEPYADDPSTRGVAVLEQDEINAIFAAAHEHGLQVSGHAIGDRAMQLMLNGFRHVLATKPTPDARPRIIHAQITTPGILAEMQEMGVVADIQPTFVGTDLHIVEQRVGHERATATYAWRTMREMGIATAGGSDSPVESCSPLLGIYSAVTRQDADGYPAGGWLPNQKLTAEESIELFTMGSAFACFEEGIKGSISAGKLADLVVLAEDITAVAPEKIKDVQVVATYVGGKKAF
ncbi:MAG: amidohydrolase, partial [Bacillota bacterium]